MPVFPSAGAAYAALVAGIWIGYVELLRPGLIIPGAAGSVLALLGLSSLVSYVVEPRAIPLIGAGLVLVFADAHWQGRGAVALAGSLLVASGTRWLVGTKIGWMMAAGLGVPFLLTTWWLVGQAIRARALKAAI